VSPKVGVSRIAIRTLHLIQHVSGRHSESELAASPQWRQSAALSASARLSMLGQFCVVALPLHCC
jgi:hypothetical protein